MALIVRHIMQTPWCLGIMGFSLIIVPILGMWAVHKYKWQHWEPFYYEPDSETTRKPE